MYGCGLLNVRRQRSCYRTAGAPHPIKARPPYAARDLGKVWVSGEAPVNFVSFLTLGPLGHLLPDVLMDERVHLLQRFLGD